MDSSDDDDEVFDEKNITAKRDLIMAKTGIHLTYLGSLQVEMKNLKIIYSVNYSILFFSLQED